MGGSIDTYYFVNEKKLEGLFPIILKKMIQERKNVRDYMKKNDKVLTYD